MPQRRIENVNCAMTAVNSHTALDFISDILEHDPDLVLVYMGHDEFYGPGGVGSNTADLSKANPAVRFLLELRLTALLRRALKIGYSRDAPLPVRNVMEMMAAEQEIRYDSPLRKEAVRIFSSNLTKLVTRCRDRQVPVVLCEVSSNLRTQEPFGSAHRAGFAEQLEFDALLQKAGEEQGQGNLPAALEAARRAVQLDSTFARARYLAGQILDGLEDTGAARKEYAAAREMDTVPFRAPAEINRVIHRIAADQGVPLVAVDSLLSLGSPGGIAGDEFFLEHLHFNLHGNGWVSRAIAARMYDVGLPAPRDRWRWREELRPVEYARMAGVTELDIEIGDQRVHMLKQRWPYLRAGGIPVPYTSDRDEKMVDLARAFIHQEIDLNEAHIQLGAYYKEKEDLWRALPEYLSAFRMSPLDPAPAIEAGELWLRLDQPFEAGRVLVRVLELRPDEERGLLLLAHAFLGTGSPERAAATIARVLQLNPDSAPALALRDTLATMMGPGAR
ncbi:MAG: tetratricopeptide repeat protein [Candidatus Eisenbacteria bacterium]